MSDRQRTTWQSSGDKAATASQPVLPVERARAASAHPATPDEGAAHPAHEPDPGEHDYENGTTETWAEDPTTGPYPNSAHPATPDEGAGHPAHSQSETGGSVGEDQVTNEDLGVSKAAARELRAKVERKAAKCIRISTALLGPRATIAMVEDQALDFMDMSDTSIVSTLSRLAEDKGKGKEEEDEAAETIQEEVEEKDEKKDEKKASDEKDEDEDEETKKEAADEALLRKMLAEEEDEDEEGKEASVEISASDKILAAIEGLGSRLTALETGKTSMEDDTMLAQLLEEEDMVEVAPVAEEEDVEAMLNSMLDETDTAACGEVACDVMDEVDIEFPPGELGIEYGGVEDPMGLLGEVEIDDEEEALLSSLFADTRLAGDESDEDEGKEASDDEDEDGKTAGRRPRPKKASAGASRLGRVSKEAASEVKELEKLWPSAPDVSGVFG